MRTALYFPHTEVHSESIVRTALLTWDKLEYITPYRDYRPKYKNRNMSRAMELIGEARVPKLAEQKRVHELVEDLLQEGVPETFKYSPADGTRTPEYEIWPQKLAQETWTLLRDHGLTDGFIYHDHRNMDYPTSQAAGLTLMAILADVLAGDTRARITDRRLAYATIANAPRMTVHAQEPTRVVPLTFNAVGLGHIPIDRLIAFREREEKSTGNDYETLRHNYLAAVEKHVARISSVPIGSADRIELDRIFASDMAKDMRDLKKELRLAEKDAWFSKDVLTTLVIAGTVLTAATSAQFQMPEVIAGTGGAVLVGGLFDTSRKLAKSRCNVLREHPMAYLYQLES
jgi:hypothetical protein